MQASRQSTNQIFLPFAIPPNLFVSCIHPSASQAGQARSPCFGPRDDTGSLIPVWIHPWDKFR